MAKSSGQKCAEGAKVADVRLSGPMFLHRLSVNVEAQWPNMRFLGFGCYYAWIFLLYNSNILLADVDATQSTGIVTQMYLFSTVALAVCLVGGAVAARHVEGIVARPGVVLAAGAIVAVGTFGSMAFSGNGLSLPFAVCSIATGVGTSVLALRFGVLYAKLESRDILMQTAIAFIFSCFLYYTVVGAPALAADVLMVLLPLFSAGLSLLDASAEDESPIPCAGSSGVQRREGSMLGCLAVSMLVRMVVMVAVFSLAVGVVRGFSTALASAATLSGDNALIIFGICLVAVVLFVVGGLLRFNVDISRLYYPIILLVTVGIVAVPFLGASVLLRNQVVSIGYNCFIIVVWCLLAFVSHRTGASPIVVFGFGRGASAAGTVVGWYVGAHMAEGAADALTSVSVGLIVVVLAISMLVFNESTLREAIARRPVPNVAGASGRSPEGAEEANAANANASADADANVEANANDGVVAAAPAEGGEGGHPAKGRWRLRCEEVAAEFGLSGREEEVMVLLAKGNSIEKIGEILSVSFNTSKTHVRNVYVKLGIHSRQELFDLIGKK